MLCLRATSCKRIEMYHTFCDIGTNKKIKLTGTTNFITSVRCKLHESFPVRDATSDPQICSICLAYYEDC